MVLRERSCHKEYTCVILKSDLYGFKVMATLKFSSMQPTQMLTVRLSVMILADDETI